MNRQEKISLAEFVVVGVIALAVVLVFVQLAKLG